MTASTTHPGGYDAFYARLDNFGEPRSFWHPQRKKTKLFITCNFDREVISEKYGNATLNNTTSLFIFYLGNLLFRQKRKQRKNLNVF